MTVEVVRKEGIELVFCNGEYVGAGEKAKEVAKLLELIDEIELKLSDLRRQVRAMVKMPSVEKWAFEFIEVLKSVMPEIEISMFVSSDDNAEVCIPFPYDEVDVCFFSVSLDKAVAVLRYDEDPEFGMVIKTRDDMINFVKKIKKWAEREKISLNAEW